MSIGEFVDGNIVEIYMYKDTPHQVIVNCSLLGEKEDMDKFIKELNERSEYDLLLQEFEHNYSEEITTLFLQKRRKQMKNPKTLSDLYIFESHQKIKKQLRQLKRDFLRRLEEIEIIFDEEVEDIELPESSWDGLGRKD